MWFNCRFTPGHTFHNTKFVFKFLPQLGYLSPLSGVLPTVILGIKDMEKYLDFDKLQMKGRHYLLN